MRHPTVINAMATSAIKPTSTNARQPKGAGFQRVDFRIGDRLAWLLSLHIS